MLVSLTGVNERASSCVCVRAREGLYDNDPNAEHRDCPNACCKSEISTANRVCFVCILCAWFYGTDLIGTSCRMCWFQGLAHRPDAEAEWAQRIWFVFFVSCVHGSMVLTSCIRGSDETTRKVPSLALNLTVKRSHPAATRSSSALNL